MDVLGKDEDEDEDDVVAGEAMRSENRRVESWNAVIASSIKQAIQTRRCRQISMKLQHQRQDPHPSRLTHLSTSHHPQHLNPYFP